MTRGMQAWAATVAVLAAAATVFTACASAPPTADADRTGSGGSGDAVAATELGDYYEQRPDWGPCADPIGLSAARSAECATVAVPLDYADPGGTQAELAVVRIAAGDRPRPAVLVNPGGPGMSGLDWAAWQLNTLTAGPIGAEFDLVSFDPRGVGRSTPAARCRDDADLDAYRHEDLSDPSPDGIARTEQVLAELAASCAENTGTDVLAHLGTRETAADMDVLRAVLGRESDPAGAEAPLRYIGLSYGTRLGTEYAARYGDRVGAMVLDGAVLPGLSGTDRALAQAAGFQAAFDAFAVDCATRPNCPLPAEPEPGDPGETAAATAAVSGLLARIAEEPLPTAGGRTLGRVDAQLAIMQALYTPELWPMLRTGLAEALDGGGQTLLGLADMYYGRGPDGAYPANLHDAFDAIRCVDAPAVTDPGELADAAAQAAAAAPVLEDGRGAEAAAREVCAFWPVPVTAEIDPHIDSATGEKILVVSSTGDPATPHVDGIALAELLGAQLLVVDADKHTAVFADPCVDAAAADRLAGRAVTAERCP